MKPHAVFLLLVLLAIPQRPSNWPKPPAPAEPPTPVARNSHPQQHRVDTAQLQHEAKELLDLSQSIQPDIESVSRGLLPKDTVEKLKRIEKLAKQLRQEIAP